ncbi:MAG: hypothetical protein ACLU8S_11925 [Coprococcus phoceensis]
MIRYGGLYARHRKTDEKLYRAISKKQTSYLPEFQPMADCHSFLLLVMIL